MFFMDHHLRLNEHENCCGLIKVARFFGVYNMLYFTSFSSLTSRGGLEMFGKKPKSNPRHYKVSLKCTTHSDLQFPRSLTSDKKNILLYIIEYSTVYMLYISFYIFFMCCQPWFTEAEAHVMNIYYKQGGSGQWWLN